MGNFTTDRSYPDCTHRNNRRLWKVLALWNFADRDRARGMNKYSTCFGAFCGFIPATILSRIEIHSS